MFVAVIFKRWLCGSIFSESMDTGSHQVTNFSESMDTVGTGGDQAYSHYRRPAVCRVPGSLSSVVFWALSKDFFVECFFFDTRQRGYLPSVFLTLGKESLCRVFFLTLGKELLCRVFFLHSAKKISKHILKQ